MSSASPAVPDGQAVSALNGLPVEAMFAQIMQAVQKSVFVNPFVTLTQR